MSGVQFKNVFVGIAGQNIRTVETTHTKYIDNNMISQSDIDQLTKEVYNLNKEPGEEIIHVIPQSYSVDNTIIGLSPVGCSGKKLDGRFYVVLGQANAIQKIKQAIQLASLNIIKLIYQPIASAEAVLSCDEKEVGTLVADIGAGTTDVSIFYDKILRTTASIPFGGNSITNDIKVACQLLQRQAEALKVNHASALFGNKHKVITIKGSNGRASKEISLMDLASITNARMEEILAGIAFVMNKSGLSNSISDIVLTGGGSKLANLTQLVKFRFDRDVRIAKPRDIVVGSNMLSGVEYSTISGLLTKGFAYLEENEARIKEEAAASSNENKSSQKQEQKTVPESGETKSEKKKSGLFSFLKSLANDFFVDPKDSKM